jgi:phosphoenolpyruvate-protein kinase (PTS system EI component)
MFSKIKDLDRYKQDQKRFRLAIASTEEDIQEQGKKLLADLNSAVESFDNVMEQFVSDPAGSRMDHATAQKQIAEAKRALENWVLRYAPNIHVETTKY